ncbi:MAG: integrase core domain-containing protein [Candidatus Acidiferrales bacterium]
MLEGLREKGGTPAAIQVDNGTEFTSGVVDQWASQNHVALHFIERGKPMQNALFESFNGKFRYECLNHNWFVDLRHAREVTEACRGDYKIARPHSSLRHLTPEEFAPNVAARPASPPTPVVSITPAWPGSDAQELEVLPENWSKRGERASGNLGRWKGGLSDEKDAPYGGADHLHVAASGDGDTDRRGNPEHGHLHAGSLSLGEAAWSDGRELQEFFRLRHIPEHGVLV